MKNKNRVEYLDSVGGILLIHMILWHCWQWANLPQDAYWLRFLSFFMPWFFFKAGMFFQPNDNIVIIKKGWERLMMPYIIYSLLGTCVLCVKLIISKEFDFQSFVITFFSSIIKTGSVPGNLPLWFLLSLFIVRIVYNASYNKLGNKYIWCILILPVLIKIVFDFTKIEFPFYIFNIATGIFFYLLGNKLKKMNINWSIVAISTLLYLSSVIFLPQIVDMRTNMVIYGNYYGWLLISIIGIIAINALSFKILNYKNIFSLIGKDTMPIYCWHWIVILIVSSIGFINHQNKYEYFLIEIVSILLFMLCLIFINKKIWNCHSKKQLKFK